MSRAASQTYDWNLRGRSGSGRDTGLGELIGSMIGFASASTIFALQQIRHSFEMFVAPAEVMNRVRHSLDDISHAMNRSVDNSNEEGNSGHRSEPQSAARIMDPTTSGTPQMSEEEVLTGRKR